MIKNIKAQGNKIVSKIGKYIVLKHVNHSFYTKKCLLVYIIKPFIKGTKARHPNYYEAKSMVSVLDNLGYDVDVVFFCNERFKKFRKYDLIIGLGDCFDNSVGRCKDGAIRIYYATGANFITSFSNEIQRWIDIYDKKGVVMSPSRFGMPRNPQLAVQSMKSVEGIITVGGQWCASTYNMWNTHIYQVGVIPFMHYSYMDMNRDLSKCRYNFLWLGGKGLVHKGLDIVLEAFSKMPKYNLYVACNYEKEFLEKYREELGADNVHYVGFVNIDSDMFFQLAANCAYTISVSCSEGTCTSVITCMYTGLIPITSQGSGIDFGYKLDNCNVASITNMLDKVNDVENKELAENMRKSYKYIQENYTIDSFERKFESAMRSILEEHKR